MFGPAGHLYCYFTYGMHWCANVVCGRDGVAARSCCGPARSSTASTWPVRRRPAARRDADLARGPARLAACLGLAAGAQRRSTCSTPPRRCGSSVSPARRPRGVQAGPRVGISAAADRPWRFWLAGEPVGVGVQAGWARRGGGRDRQTEAVSETAPPDRRPAARPARRARVLASGAAQILPADGLAERLLRRPPRAPAAAGQARHRPVRLRPDARARRRAAQAAPVPGPRAHRGAGRRRVHRPGGRPVRAHGHPRRAERRRRHRQRPRLLRPADAHPRPRAHRGRQQRRLARRR